MQSRDPQEYARHLRKLGFSEDEVRKSLARGKPKKAKRGKAGYLLEHEEQKKVIRWAREWRLVHPALDRLFAVPNGAKRSRAEAAWAKAEGLKSGVPDLILPFAARGFHGLAIEMKSCAPDAEASPDQTDWLEWLRANGWRAEICRGADAATETISDYLQLKDR